MSKNIYYDSSFMSNQNIIASSVTTDSIILPGAHLGDILIVGNSSNVEGLTLGSTNDVLVANPSGNSLPGYTNALNINTLTANDIKINNVQTGDLLVGVTNDYLLRLPIGATGDLLHSDGTNPYYGPLIVPDPLVLNDLVLNQSLKLNYLSNGIAFIDTSYNLFTEKAIYSTSTTPVTFTTSTSIFSINSNVIINRNYKVTISWNNLTSSGSSSTYTLNITNQTPITYVTQSVSSQENISTAFLSNTSGSITISLTGANTGGTGSNGTAAKVFIICEPLGF